MPTAPTENLIFLARRQSGHHVEPASVPKMLNLPPICLATPMSGYPRADVAPTQTGRSHLGAIPLQDSTLSVLSASISSKVD